MPCVAGAVGALRADLGFLVEGAVSIRESRGLSLLAGAGSACGVDSSSRTEKRCSLT